MSSVQTTYRQTRLSPTPQRGDLQGFDIRSTLRSVAMGSRTSPWCDRRMLILFVALMDPTSSALANTNEVLSRIVTVRAGGIRIPGPWSTNTSGVMSLRLPKPTRLEISYEPIDSASNQPIRLLRKMEGLDSEWQEAGGQMQRAEMQLLVLIHGASNQILSHRTFTMSGESEGWRGEPAKSEFRRRRESIVLPAGRGRIAGLVDGGELECSWQCSHHGLQDFAPGFHWP